MTDYTTPTGSGGILLIRDNGSTVDYFVQAGSTSTHIGTASWSATGNGGTYSYPTGRPLLYLGSATITTSQNVSLSIGATGTAGLGGPTTLTVFIARATVPSPPQSPSWSLISVNTAQFNFAGSASNGGSGIDFYLVRYGTANPPEAGAYTDISTGSGANPISGLIPGVTYYGEAYAHNAVGFSGKSPVVSMTTLAPGRSKVGGHYKYAIPYIKVAGVYKMALPFIKLLGTYKKTG